MRFFFATFLVLLCFATVFGHTAEDLPETHISDDFIDTVARRSRPKRRRLIRRFTFKLKKLNGVQAAFKRRLRKSQLRLRRTSRVAKEAAEKLKGYKKCIRMYRGKKRSECGNGVLIQKAAFKSARKRAAVRALLKTTQRRLLKILREIENEQGELDKYLGNMAPRPSVPPLALA